MSEDEIQERLANALHEIERLLAEVRELVVIKSEGENGGE